MTYRHRSSNLKQSNKKHKTGKNTSKRRIDRRDNVGGRAVSNKRNVGKYAKSSLAVEGRRDRINKTKQQAAKKKAQMIRDKRYAAGSANGAPRLVTVVSLYESIDNDTNTRCTSPIALAHDILQQMEHVSKSETGLLHFLPQYTGMIKKWNSRITLTCFQRSGDDSNDLIALLDLLKVTDVILVVVPATSDPDKLIDKFGEQVISSLRAQGFPAMIGVNQARKSDTAVGKKKNSIRKLLQRFFDTEFGDGVKVLDHMYDNTDEQQSRSDHLMDLDASVPSKKANMSASKVKAAVEQNIDQICRYLSSLRLKELHFRSMRPYFLVVLCKECENGAMNPVNTIFQDMFAGNR